MTRGTFITLEGIDGVGKSTQAALLADFLRAQNKQVLSTREPGGSNIGEKIRELVLFGDNVDAVSEVLLMAAARREHICRQIAPALKKGDWVICDRFGDSTFAYQGGGRGVNQLWIQDVLKTVQADAVPDLTFYLQMSPTQIVRTAPEKADVFNREGMDFYHAVANTYDQLAADFPGRIVVVATHDHERRRDIEEIAAEIQTTIAARLS